MKRYWKMIAAPAAAMLVLAGCGDDEEVKDPPVEYNEDQAGVDPGKSQDDGNKLSVTYKSFELDADYEGDKDYDAEYDTQGSQTEASLEDDLNNKNLKGDEAMNELQPMLEKLTFNKDDSDADVIKQVKEAFNLDENYTKLEIEVVFDDGTEKEYKEQK